MFRLLKSSGTSATQPDMQDPGSPIEGNPLAMWIHDRETTRILEVNESALIQYGYTREEFLRLSMADLKKENSPSASAQTMSPQGREADQATTHVKRDRSLIQVIVRTNDMTYRSHPCRLVVSEDVTERRNQEARLLKLAHRDALTGLPNRTLLTEKVQQAINSAMRLDHKMAVLCIDLDRFKQINDWYGHAIGDDCLRQLGAMLTGRLRGMDTVARTGGEEFTAVLGEVKSLQGASAVGKALLEALRKPFDVEGHQIHLRGSIGVAVYPDHGEDAPELCRCADAAMYRAKRAGGNRSLLAGPDMSTVAEENAALDSYVTEMLQADRLEMHYQPQYGSNRKLHGTEALLRLPDAEGTYISPDRFIPHAEVTGLIHPIGCWAINEACRQLRAWNKPGVRPVRVAVNVSPLQLMRAEFADGVQACMARWGVNPAWLEMEITERVMLDFDEVGRKMRALHALGIRFAVDDFGVGYSSLQHLQRLPISTVKVDRSFVRRLCSPAGSFPIIQAIIAMGHSLGMEVIAEGIETEEQREVLEELGCDAMQGYLFSRPVPADTITELLRSPTPSSRSRSSPLSTS